MSLRVLLPLVLALAACVPSPYKVENWSHVEGTQPQQRAEDNYACMKENTSYQYRNNEQTGESAGAEIDPFLFSACMEARGYQLRKPARSG